MKSVLPEADKSHFIKKVIRIGLPITLSQLLTSLLAFIDTFMVSGLGDEAVGAVGIGANYYFLMIMINFGLVSGLSIFFAQYWGSNDVENIHKTFLVSFILSQIIVVIFFTFGFFFSDTIISLYNNSGDINATPLIQEFGVKYLKIATFSYPFTAITFVISMMMRSMEKVIFPQLVAVLMVVLNTVLNYLLIGGNFGFPSLGIEGAATATLLSSIVGASIFAIYILTTKRSEFRVKITLLQTITKDFLRKLLKKALPVALNETLWGLGMTLYLIAFSFVSADAIPSYHISNQIMSMFWVFNAGVASACAVMLGNKLGEAKIEIAKLWGRRFLVISFGFGFLFGGLLFLSSGLIPNYFTNISASVRDNVTLILMIFSFFVPIKFVNALHIIGTLRSGGDTVFAFVAEVGVLWGIGVPLAFILSLYTSLPLHIIVLIVNGEEVVKFFLVNSRFFTYKWANNLTN
jgi:putative MATE family efflux protein